MTDNLKVVLFKSRNKDNRQIEDFVERTESFLTDRDVESLQDRFQAFVNKGLSGEMSRFYMSVNNRDNAKVKKALLHHLIDDDNFDMSKIENKTVSLASRKESRKENKWLFDFDEIIENPKGNYQWAMKNFDKDEMLHQKMLEFLEDLLQYFKEDDIKTQKTPNGYAIIVPNGFDTRELLSKWENVSLKRDDLLCCGWDIKPFDSTDK